MTNWDALQPWSAEPSYLETVIGYISGEPVRFGELWTAARQFQQAQARIAELEGQAAVVAKAADDYLHQRLGHGPKDVGEAAQRLDDVLANLPAAVQRHLVRDRAAAAMVLRSPYDTQDDGSRWCHYCGADEGLPHDVECEWAAYREAGGEGT